MSAVGFNTSSTSLLLANRVLQIPQNVQHALEEFFPGRLSELTLTPLKTSGNIVLKVDSGDEVCVVRQSFPAWTEERCRREVMIAIWVEESQMGPQVLQVSQDFRFMKLEYFNGGEMHPYEPISLKELAHCLHELHKIGLPPPMQEEIMESTTFKRFYSQFSNLQQPLPGELNDLVDEVKRMEEAFKKLDFQWSLCHLDLHAHNIMRHNGKLRLVDYGMCGTDHPYFDLANFSLYKGLSEEERKELLQEYLGDKFSENEYLEFQFILPLVYLNKITWPITKAFLRGGTPEQLQEIWSDDKVTDLQDHFKFIFDGTEPGAEDLFRYGKAAYQRFKELRHSYLSNW